MAQSLRILGLLIWLSWGAAAQPMQILELQEPLSPDEQTYVLNGLNWIVRKFKGFLNYAHIVLKGERSRGPITDMVLKSKL